VVVGLDQVFNGGVARARLSDRGVEIADGLTDAGIQTSSDNVANSLQTDERMRRFGAKSLNWGPSYGVINQTSTDPGFEDAARLVTVSVSVHKRVDHLDG
jgi:hypothetical protein